MVQVMGSARVHALVALSIVGFSDIVYFEYVECVLVDADNNTHVFIDKQASVSEDFLGERTVFPTDGGLACEIEASWVDDTGCELMRINTNTWDRQSNEGKTVFVVLADQVTRIDPDEWAAGMRPARR
jgi:hypothetical protein